MEVLLIISLFLALVTLIGHGIWVLLARLFRGSPANANGMRCTRCGAMVQTYPCRQCGFAPAVDQRRATREVLRDLVARGLIDEQTHQRVQEALTSSEGPALAVPKPLTEARPARPARVGPPLIPEARLHHAAVSDESPAVSSPTSSDATARPPAMPPAPSMRPAYFPPVSRPPEPPRQPPRPPAKPFAHVLASFMEERNIRWGELIGGMLVVGFSVALVLSLWVKISQRPFLKVSIFTSVVAVLFTLGLYVGRKWKVPTSAFSILLIAMLMVPLHLCAMVVIGGDQTPMVLVAEALGVLLLGWLSYLAAGVITPNWRGAATSGLMALSISGPAMYMAELMGPEIGRSGMLRGGGAIVTLLLGFTGAAIWKLGRIGEWRERHAAEATSVIGVLLAAAIPSLMMHAYFGAASGEYRMWMAPIWALLAIPLLECSAALRKRIEMSDAWMTAMVGVAGFAGLWLVVCAVLGWPMPATAALAGIVATAVLAVHGLYRRDAVVFNGSYVMLAATYAAAVPAIMGRVGWMDASGALGSSVAGAHLALEWLPLAAITGAAGALVKKRLPAASLGGFILAGVTIALGLLHLLVSVYANEVDLPEAKYLFCLYAAGAIAAGVLTRNRYVMAGGAGLLVLAIERVFPGRWIYALASVATVAACLSAAGRWAPAAIWRDLKQMAAENAWWTGALAAVLVGVAVPTRAMQESAGLSWWLAGVALILCVAMQGRAELAAFQLLLTGTALLQTFAIAGRYYGYDDLRIWAIAGAVVVGMQGLWALAQWALAKRPSLEALVEWEFSPARIMGVIASALLLLVAGLTLAGAAGAELGNSVSDPSLLLLFHGLWIAMAAVLIVSLTELLASRKESWSMVAIVAAFALGDVVACRLSPEMAASALRMSSIGLLLLFSGLIWSVRGAAGRTLQKDSFLWLILALGAVPLLALTLIAANLQLSGSAPRSPLEGSLWARLGAFGSYIVPLALLAATLAAHAIIRRSHALAILCALVVHLTVTLAFMLERGVDNPNDAAVLLLFNAVSAGAFAWAWLLIRRLVLRREDEAPIGLKALAAICCIAVIALGVMGEMTILFGLHIPLGILPGEVALAWIATALAGSLLWKLRPERQWVPNAFWMLLVLAVLLAQTAGVIGVGRIVQFRTILVGHTLAVVALYFFSRWMTDRGAMQAGNESLQGGYDEPQVPGGPLHLAYASQPSAMGRGVSGSAADAVIGRALPWAIAMAVLAFIAAVGALVRDPQAPWWTVASLMTLVSLGVMVAQRELRPGFLYPSTLAACVSGSVLWAWHAWGSYAEHHLVMLNLLMLGACGMVSVILEKQIFAPAEGHVIGRWQRLHVPASWLCVGVLILVAMAHLVDPGGVSDAQGILLGIAACGTVLALAVARYWDHRRPGGMGLLYVGSFASMGMLLAMAGIARPELVQQLLICAIGMTILWGILLRRHAEIERWMANLQAQIPPAGFWPKMNAWLGIACVLLMLMHEMALAGATGSAPMRPWLIIVFAALLLSAAGLFIATALSRIDDFLLLPFRKRETYVFAAEGALLLLFLHTRLTCPWLFSGVMQQWWPMILLVIAFAMTGAGEILNRRGLRVIGAPLLQSAFVLPLVPALFFGAVGSRVPYAAVAASAAAYYGLLAATRRSAAAIVLAMLAANATIWALLWDNELLAFARHPQLWIIPPALCLIALSHVMKGRLSEQQVGALRYTGLLAAYVASTSDILLIGVAQAPWLAGVLGLISVAGVLAGIVLRVRSFLYTGTAFLAVSLLTLIYHAKVNLQQTWIMWLAGVGLGVIILLAFAMFERHKEKIGRVMDEMRQWDA